MTNTNPTSSVKTDQSKQSTPHSITETDNHSPPPPPLPETNFSFLYRVKMDVTVNAPIILLPYKDQALLLDCGLITVKTNLDIINEYYDTNKDLQLNDGREFMKI